MNYNILLVGYGNIGKRYLEGILKSQLNITVLIIDNNIDEKFEDNFKNKNLHFSNSYKKFKKIDVDLLINTTYASQRFDLIKNYCDYFNVKNLNGEGVLLRGFLPGGAARPMPAAKEVEKSRGGWRGAAGEGGGGRGGASGCGGASPSPSARPGTCNPRIGSMSSPETSRTSWAASRASRGRPCWARGVAPCG